MTDWSTQDRRAFLTVAEVAAKWHVSTDKVRADIRKGALQAYTVAGCIRVRLGDAESYGRPVVPA